MNLYQRVGLSFCFLGLAVSPAIAGGTHASCDEAKAMSEKAAAYLKSEGPEKAFAKMMDKDGGFVDRDLYVYAVDKDGIYKVHAAKPIMVGKNGMELKDINGFAFIKAATEVKDADWVSYKYPDPTDNSKVKDKKSYVSRVGEYVVGVGCYLEQ